MLKRLVKNYDAGLARDPETGIMRGAEPLSLGPASSRKAVLFVHGFSGSPRDFHDLPDRVAGAGWRVRAPLLPGHGTSCFDFEGITIEGLVEAVRNEVRALREHSETLVVLGHSMGGALATLVAAETPVDGLILAAPYYGITHKCYYLLPVERWAKLLSPLVRWVYSSPTRLPIKRAEARKDIVCYAWIPMRAALTVMRLAERARAPELLDAITVPVLLVHSRSDSVASPEAAAHAAHALSSEIKRTVWLDRSDHIIFWDYDREMVAREVLTFLAERG